jgi:hypothetical protein
VNSVSKLIPWTMNLIYGNSGPSQTHLDHMNRNLFLYSYYMQEAEDSTPIIIMMILCVLMTLGGVAVWWFFLREKPSPAPAPKRSPAPRPKRSPAGSPGDPNAPTYNHDPIFEDCDTEGGTSFCGAPRIVQQFKNLYRSSTGTDINLSSYPEAWPGNHVNDGTACIFEFHRNVNGVDLPEVWTAKYNVDLNGDGARCSLSTKDGPDTLIFAPAPGPAPPGGDLGPCGDICNSASFVTAARNMITVRKEVDEGLGNLTDSEENTPHNGVRSCTMYFASAPGVQPRSSFVQYDATTCGVSETQDESKLHVAAGNPFYGWAGQP